MVRSAAAGLDGGVLAVGGLPGAVVAMAGFAVVLAVLSSERHPGPAGSVTGDGGSAAGG